MGWGVKHGSCGNTSCTYVLSFHQKMSSECCRNKKRHQGYVFMCLWTSASADGDNKRHSPDLIKATSLAGDCDQLFAIFLLCRRSKKYIYENIAELRPSAAHACVQRCRAAHLILSSSSTSLQVRRPSLSRWLIISYPMLLIKSSVWNHNSLFHNFHICRE